MMSLETGSGTGIWSSPWCESDVASPSLSVDAHESWKRYTARMMRKARARRGRVSARLHNVAVMLSKRRTVRKLEKKRSRAREGDRTTCMQRWPGVAQLDLGDCYVVQEVRVQAFV